MKRETRHIPVLMDQVLEALSPRPGQTIVDCTLGLGGHSSALLHHISPGGRLIAIDFDPKNIELATTVLQATGGNFSLFHNNFAALPTILAEAGVERVDGILADLGVASPQIDDPARGFSYKHDGPLDMRMDPTRGQPASVLINRIGQDELERALIELGDEEDAAAIAELVVERREVEPIKTCAQLTQIVCDARQFTLQRALGAKLHPAARTFQALRILVNRELANLQRLLAIAPACLNPGGTIAIISFHSGEDRIVKDAFKSGLHGGQFESVSKEAIIADEFEREDNPRSRSAKLRWARTVMNC
jgi:16S rRNA (cytosine1402-N4)-methyltransferase